MIDKRVKNLARKILLEKRPEPLSEITTFGQFVKNEFNSSVNSSCDSVKKKFYVIQVSPGAGFFSNFFYVLNHLKIADEGGYVPIIDFENFPNWYNENESINGNRNSWAYYFDQVSSYALDEVYSSNSFIVTSGKWLENMKRNITEDFSLKNIFHKYISIHENIINECNAFERKHFSEGGVLGVHLRGGDLRTEAAHAFPPTKKQISNNINLLINSGSFSKIFLVTENLELFNFMNSEFPGLICSLDSYRSFGNTYLEYPRKNHRYLLGKEILQEAILLSKCSQILCGESNVTEFAHFFSGTNPDFIKKIFNGVNSSNPLIARYLWGIKNILPSWAGGFKRL